MLALIINRHFHSLHQDDDFTPEQLADLSAWNNGNPAPNAVVTLPDFWDRYIDASFEWDEINGLTEPTPNYVLNRFKEDKIGELNKQISARILSGFNHEIDGVLYKFSYDTFDQQNFVDNAQIAQISGVTIEQRAYTEDGVLHTLTLTGEQFLSLYTNGAMAHKIAVQKSGRIAKSAVMAAVTVQEAASIVFV